ncbi:hypothetical protein [Natronobacterium gregoryi]|uniref:Right handed beta helix region n=2 Tax=Natronobacterium gregoryi TaxID=44930 RepID=L0ANN2_NATGS|nr:hypothetical protein [Natronobacterium gregoryi]AFZ74670.1 hypothetical protein Natgr_3555 [Natronobacterium gregoryi SP2]ELY73425.1 hypothetical protein C490_01630 [Natronobacterium gregoryi SP2]PLK20917.1 hypothetical protein CYV19_06550 [Natronobacterium gregoryi SP2]SFJ05172.1 hypothetical protein SAMN05443661_11288 [Natronobacterium gregoryi]
MAREPSVLDDEAVADDDTTSGAGGGNSELLGRRSYVKLAGATTVAAATTVPGTASADEEYDEITAQGQTITIGRGETFENKLIDLTTGDTVTLLVEGGDSVIRNVGFEGLHRGSGFMLSITAPSGDVLIENVYLGDGSTKAGGSHTHGPGAVFMHRNANCDVTFRHCNVQGYPNNGFYCSNTAYGGSARFESCYGKNNGVSTFRVAGGNDAIVDCVAYNDNTDYGPGWGGYVEDAGRPLWVWPGGTPTIEDSEFAAGSYPYAAVVRGSGSAQMTDGAIQGPVQGSGLQRSGISRSADLSIPDGVPTSAQEAAAGKSVDDSSPDSGDDEDELPHVLLFEGDDVDVSRYEFVVDGTVEPTTDDGATIDAETEIEDGFVHGVVADWKDAFRFDGDLETLTVDGPATVVLEGEEIDPDEYGEELPHVLTVEGQGEPTSFEVTVDGTVEYDGEADPDDDATTVSGSTVQSSLTDESQTFRFSGAITDVTIIEGEAVVSVDGEEIDPDEYGDDELLPHAILVDGTGTDGPTSYSFVVSGRAVEATFQELTIDDEQVYEDGVVRGVVGDERDAYWFDGGFEDFTLLGDATVDVQYNAREQ